MNLLRRIAFVFFAATVSHSVLAQPAVRVGDRAIFVAVEAALRDAPALAGADIKVTSRRGAVTLRGFAATMEDIATAGRLAARVRGVSAVDNKIRIADQPSRA
jgi:osmotically-inducible protein OsmY